MSSGCSKVFTPKDKILIAVIAGLLFLLMSSPFLYEAIESLLAPLGFHVAKGGCPNFIGLSINTVLFIIVVRILIN